MEPTGPVTKHIHVSHGGESYPMKFYSTHNEVTYGQHWADFVPRTGTHIGAGFVPNNRPFIAYRPGADPENTRMGPLLASNYLTMTHKDYIGHSYPRGNENLPDTGRIHPSGFVREKGLHIPLTAQGPFNPSTQYKDAYKAWPSVTGSFAPKGTKTPSGYTSNNSLHEPVTFIAGSNHNNLRPGWMTHRPLGENTMYATSYRPMKYPHGAEPLPDLVKRSALNSGFTTGNPPTMNRSHNPELVYDLASKMCPAKLEKLKRDDPVEYLNAHNPNWDPTVYKGQFTSPQIDNVKASVEGDPGDTGFTNNNKGGLIWDRDPSTRFVTHNMTAYHDPTSVFVDRQGHLGFDVDPVTSDGFTKSTMINKIEPQIDSFRMLRMFKPYQARSIAAREYVTTSPTKNTVMSF